MNLKEYYKEMFNNELSEGSRSTSRLQRKATGIAKRLKRLKTEFPNPSDSMGHDVSSELVSRGEFLQAQIADKISSSRARYADAIKTSAIGDKPARQEDARLKAKTGFTKGELAKRTYEKLDDIGGILAGTMTPDLKPTYGNDLSHTGGIQLPGIHSSSGEMPQLKTDAAARREKGVQDAASLKRDRDFDSMLARRASKEAGRASKEAAAAAALQAEKDRGINAQREAGAAAQRRSSIIDAYKSLR